MRSPRFIRFFSCLRWQVLQATWQQAAERRLTGLAAEMAYNAMLALFPAVLAIFAAISLFDSVKFTFTQLALQISKIAPKEALFLIRGFVQEVSNAPNQQIFSFSFAAALWAFSGAIAAAMTALDQIYQIPTRQTRPFWRARGVAVLLAIGAIFLLVFASFLVFASDRVVVLVASKSGKLEPNLLALWQLGSWPVALGIVAVAFAFVYRYGPSYWQSGTPILPGAVLAAIAWAILSACFRLYVANFGNYNKAYGSVGAVIVLMLWLYMSSLVMLLGAQLNVTVGKAMRSQLVTRAR